MAKLAENAGFGFDKIDDNWIAYNNTKPEYDIEFDSVILKMQCRRSDKRHCGENRKTSEN
jgi:predicted HTH transcriptional regulator